MFMEEVILPKSSKVLKKYIKTNYYCTDGKFSKNYSTINLIEYLNIT